MPRKKDKLLKKRYLFAAALVSTLLFAGCNKKVQQKPVETVKSGKVAPAVAIARPFDSGELTDQFGRKGRVTPDTKKVMMVFSKATGHLVKTYLNEKPADYLAKEHVVFIADVSGMPSFILKYMALPDLQKHRYPIYLITDEKKAKKFKPKGHEDQIMIIDLNHGVVEEVEFVTTKKDLQEAID